jgi:hypothetical protein
MKRFVPQGLAVLFVLLMAWGASAQNPFKEKPANFDEVFVFYDSDVRIFYPSTWKPEQRDNGLTYLTTRETSLLPLFYTYDFIEEAGYDPEDPKSVLKYRLENFYDGKFDAKNYFELTIENEQFFAYRGTLSEGGTAYDSWEVVRYVTDNFILVGAIFPNVATTVLDADFDTAFVILAHVEEWYGNEDGTMQFLNRFVYDIPEGWEVGVSKSNVMYVTDQVFSAEFAFLNAEKFEEANVEAGTYSNAVPHFLAFLYRDGAPYAPVEMLEVIEVDGVEVAIAPYEAVLDGEAVVGTLLLAYVEDGTLVALDVYALDGESEIEIDGLQTLAQMLVSVRLMEGFTAP